MQATEKFAMDKLALHLDCHRFRNRFQICVVWIEIMRIKMGKSLQWRRAHGCPWNEDAIAEAGRVDILVNNFAWIPMQD